ncbi:MAG: ATP-binding protein [Acidimicrobiales bacterium]|nr:ATP-binding protein [Acidimicrobiales bacterium]
MGALLGAAAVAALGLMARRRETARLRDSVHRLVPDLHAEGALRVPEVLVRLDRAVDQARGQVERERGVRARLEQALEAIPQGVVIAADDGAVLYRNHGAQAYVDARHAEALVEAAVTEQLARARRGRADTQVLDLYGPPRRTLVVSSVPMPTAGRVGALAVIEDITERRRLEEVRRDFVANISHELKSPIGALSLLAETLVDEEDLDVTRRLAERLQAEAARVGRTVDDLLELSRIESSELPTSDLVPVHLVVAEAVSRIRPAAEQAGIDLEVQEPNRRLAVLGDRRQLISALYNLLENAVKYSEPASSVEVRATTDGTVVEIAVVDHGIGIPARDLERVFERFYRVDQARSRKTGGTGLGLAIVRHVANNHRGEVTVSSRLGEGSTFALRLPTASGPVAVDLPEAAAS